MSTDLWMAGMTTEADHRVTRVLVGDAETLRARLTEAVERLGYQVISDQTAIVARRGARGMGSSGCSINVRDYPTELIVTLKPKGASAALATFNFTVKNFYYWTRGDRRTLEREAEAIAALTVAHGSVAACASCGTETTDDSRFCRRCGAPLALAEPAELETLRLTAGARASQKNIAFGVVALLVSALAVLVVLGAGFPKSARGAAALAVLGAAMGLFPLLLGMWRLNRTLNPKRAGAETDEFETAASPRAFAAPPTAALPPRSAQSSITEGTTELLERHLEEPAPVPVRRQRGDTGPIN